MLFCAGEDFSYYEAETEVLAEKAESGDAEAQYWLGSRFFHGHEDVPMDNRKAVEWLQKAVDQKNADAQALLGYMHVAAYGLPPSAETGMVMLHESAAQTNRSAFYYLGLFYEKGRGGVTADRFEAMDWYLKAARLGHEQSKKNLKRMRDRSDEVRLGTAEPEWWEIPLEELEASAEKGDADAQRRMGLRYRGYGGTEVDFNKAQYWLEKSVAQTNLSAHLSLASLCLSGTNVMTDKAFEHSSIAAEGGDRDAQYTLGRYYRDGVGTAADREKALEWYCRAETSGHSSAPYRIYSLMKGRVANHFPLREKQDSEPQAPKKSKSVSKGSKKKKGGKPSQIRSIKKLRNNSSFDSGVLAKDYKLPRLKLVINDFDRQEVGREVLAYDAATKTVKLNRPVGQRGSLPLSAFDRDSRSIIEGLAAYAAFEKMSVRFRRNKLSKQECERHGVVFGKNGSSDFSYEGYTYDLTFKNRELVRLQDLKVSGRFFYKQDSQVGGAYDEGPVRTSTLNKNCSLEVKMLEPESVYKAETSSFILESYGTDSGVYYRDGSPIMVDAKPLGLWVRVSFAGPDGVRVYRDFHEKSSLKSKVEW